MSVLVPLAVNALIKSVDACEDMVVKVKQRVMKPSGIVRLLKPGKHIHSTSIWKIGDTGGADSSDTQKIRICWVYVRSPSQVYTCLKFFVSTNSWERPQHGLRVGHCSL